MIDTGLPICRQCGVEYHPASFDPAVCPICSDERQYVRWDGQAWTTLEDLRDGHHNRIEQIAPGVLGIGTVPGFAIGQRALLVQTPDGNVLWDCITLLDDDTVAAIEQVGGLSAIAVSHPHYYGTMASWSEAFGDVPVFIHADDRPWVPRPGNVTFWSGQRHELGPGLTLVNARVHFDGGTVLHWAGGADGAGALLSGDIFQVVMDRRHVGFMYSYPNLIPEAPSTVASAVAAVDGLPFADIYGAFWGRNIRGGGQAALAASATRYLARTREP